jgi:hypothetical protein
MQKKLWYPSGWIIVLALLMLWPLGLFFILLRLKRDRSSHRFGAKILKLAGFVLLGFSSLALLALVADLHRTADVGSSIGGIIVLTLFAAGGVILLKTGSQVLDGISRRMVLTNHIVNHQVNSIDDIASRVQKSAGEVLYDLQEMVKGGFLPGYKVDASTRRVWRPTIAPPPLPQGAAIPIKAPEFVQFTCTGCGARNQLQKTGQRVMCEYCDVAVAA